MSIATFVTNIIGPFLAPFHKIDIILSSENYTKKYDYKNQSYYIRVSVLAGCTKYIDMSIYCAKPILIACVICNNF